MVSHRNDRNIAQVSGGERELRTMYLKPFQRACVDSLSIMTAYSSYDGIPAIANSRTYQMYNPLQYNTHYILCRSAHRYCS